MTRRRTVSALGTIASGRLVVMVNGRLGSTNPWSDYETTLPLRPLLHVAGSGMLR